MQDNPTPSREAMNIVSALESKNSLAQVGAFAMLLRTPAIEAEFIGPIVTCLIESDSPEVKMLGVAALCRLARPTSQVVPTLLSLLDGSTLPLRRYALSAILIHTMAYSDSKSIAMRGRAIEALYDAASEEQNVALRNEMIIILHSLENRDDLSNTIIRKASRRRARDERTTRLEVPIAKPAKPTEDQN
jgi:hypothetical protein